MAKSRRLEDRLVELNNLRNDPVSELALSELHNALLDKDNFIVTRAAEMAGEFYLETLEAELVRAFDRFMVNPTKTDPGCSAKTAIAETLYRLETYQEDLFLKGISHVQMEPVWGGQVDTAAKLRGTCALGLVRMNYSQCDDSPGASACRSGIRRAYGCCKGDWLCQIARGNSAAAV